MHTGGVDLAATTHRFSVVLCLHVIHAFLSRELGSNEQALIRGWFNDSKHLSMADAAYCVDILAMDVAPRTAKLVVEMNAGIICVGDVVSYEYFYLGR